MSIPGPARSYCGLLDDALAARDAAPQETKYYPLRPSSAGYCSRKLAYSLAAYRGTIPDMPDPRRPNIMRLLDLGHSIEYHALNVFKKYLPDLEQRFKQQVVDMFRLDSGRLIEGSVDVAFVTHKALVDVKSVGPRWSKGYKSTWDEMLAKYEGMSTVIKFDENAFYVHDVKAFFEEVGEDALVANITQLNLYLCTEFMKARGLDHGVIYRYNKADSRHMEVRFSPSLELYEDIRKKFNLIDQAPTPADVPRGALLGSMACAYCPWATQCWPEIAETKKEFYKTLPKKKWADRTPAALQGMFDSLDVTTPSQKEADRLTTAILQYMTEEKLGKVKLADGRVFEAKYLASPKPHYELRLTKE